MNIQAVESTDKFKNPIQVYFTNDSGLRDLNLKADSIKRIFVKEGFLMIHDSDNDEVHCYNMKYVKHFHFPGGTKLS